ncbi:MAG: Serine protease, DegP/HtrA, do-like [Oscillospiraceae bacterium]|nr:Serine protease, DegP/HtrA, do-like [Oscillospiraceae bacterium]
MYQDDHNQNTNWNSSQPNSTPGWGNSPSTDPIQDMQPVPVKIKKRWPGVVALCLVCALLGGAAGVGGSLLVSGNASSSVLNVSDRVPTTSVAVANVDGQTEYTLSEIYDTYVNSCVAIQAGSTTNIWGQEVSTASSGSGFVITSDGYILTNYHVIEGASSISVLFNDGSKYDATLIGSEEENDIAVLKIDATGLTPVVIGDSSQAEVGETVCTIGNPLGELTFSLTDGVVSALNRTVTYSDGSSINMIQTNCTINSGNSGGPLFNTYGEVIGITSAKYSSSSYSSSSASIEGLGFAIPINDVTDAVTSIMENGYVTGKAYLGISVGSVSSEAQNYGVPSGAYVASVTSGSCAETAGIQKGDIITKVDDTTITSSSDLSAAKNKYKAGDTATFTIYRDGQTLTVSVTFDEEQPDSSTDSSSSSDSSSSDSENSSSNYYGSDGSSSDYTFNTPFGQFSYGG